ASQQRGFHFTIPIAVPHSGTPVQITSLSADNHCLPGPGFHFTLPVAVSPSGTLVQFSPLSADNKIDI
ncbi:hypothetical protein K3H50_20385, partial [Aeromonas veronii]|uniref:hypothetical protein n=1 Tax=Aeromonas veronii TaxID=654 RepID=UPI001F424662